MAGWESELNVLRSEEGGRNTRRAQTRRKILAWSGPWYAFFLSFAIVWGNGLLKATAVAPLPVSFAFPLTAAVVAAIIAALNFDEDGMFDQPAAFTVSIVCGLSGTAIAALDRLGVSVALPWLAVGLILSAIAAALLFVLWSEVMARFTVSRALFYLCSDMVFAAGMLWFLDHMDAIGGYVAFLICALASCIGVHRAWESLRGTTAPHGASEHAPAAGRTARGGRAKLPLGIFVALLVYIISVVMMKTLGSDALMAHVSYGMAIGPFLMLVMIVWGRRLPLSALYELALILALLALLAQPLFGYAGNTIGIIASDAVLGLLLLLLAAINIIAVQQNGYSISRLAAMGLMLLIGAMAIGCGLGALVKTLFPWGTGLPALAACLFAIVICTVVCLSRNRRFSFDVSLAAEIAADHAAKASAAVPGNADSPQREAAEHSAAHASADSPEAGAGEAGGDAAGASEARVVTDQVAVPADAEGLFESSGREALRQRVQTIAEDRGLHEREAEVMLLLLSGMTSGQVADELCIAQGTVKAHTHNVYAKLGVHSRDELRDYASSYQQSE
ncbi:MAG: helix-turn-helix domain-containing protein [Eggerthellaceae bacterium]|jgi:DNA-binding CsgD family transcriptional regulator